MENNLLKILEMRKQQLIEQEKKAESTDFLSTTVKFVKIPSPVKKKVRARNPTKKPRSGAAKNTLQSKSENDSSETPDNGPKIQKNKRNTSKASRGQTSKKLKLDNTVFEEHILSSTAINNSPKSINQINEKTEKSDSSEEALKSPFNETKVQKKNANRSKKSTASPVLNSTAINNSPKSISQVNDKIEKSDSSEEGLKSPLDETNANKSKKSAATPVLSSTAINNSPKSINEINEKIEKTDSSEEVLKSPPNEKKAQKNSTNKSKKSAAKPKSRKKVPAQKRKTNAKKKVTQDKAKADEEHIIPIKDELPELKDDTNLEINISHSVIEGKNLFAWLIHPVKPDNFFENTWEKKPLHIKRKVSAYYQNVISTQQIDHILRNQRLDFTKNIDITSYTDGMRETHNPVGRALPPVVWDFYLNGCSVRILNPQTYINKLHLLCATLQEFFGCMVGTNSYLTPPGSQGFAPHYDDIEAFIIQVEGKKHWKLYLPRQQSEVLPRTSSTNFDPDEIGAPILDVVLNPGDLLYFPRGTIHQATTLPDEHSLHVTISMYQKNSWADLFEKLIPGMIATAVSENPIFREGLPLDISNHLGLVHSDRESTRRIEILNTLKELLIKTLDYAPCDAAVDQMCKDFQHSALPPVLTAQENACTVFGDGEVMKDKGVVENRVEMSPDTRIRLLRANIMRMVMEDHVIRIYYYIENTKEYQAVEPQYMNVDESQAPAVEFLILSYPNYVFIADIPLASDEEKVNLVQTLWEKGILITGKPLEVLED